VARPTITVLTDELKATELKDNSGQTVSFSLGHTLYDPGE
jgi:hypothetical protein